MEHPTLTERMRRGYVAAAEHTEREMLNARRERRPRRTQDHLNADWHRYVMLAERLGQLP